MTKMPLGVSMSLSSHYGSGWRDAIGPRLTNRRIAKYQKLGRYGEDMKKLQVKKTAKQLKKEKTAKAIAMFV